MSAPRIAGGVGDTGDVAGLFTTVVRGGFCIGCGVCAALYPEIRIEKDEFGRYVAMHTNSPPGEADGASPAAVCPFANNNLNEDELALERFGTVPARDKHIGFHVANYAGWVTEGEFRTNGSSGGIGSWLLVELLDRGVVDYAVHVGSVEPTAHAEPMFRYMVSRTGDEVRARAKSRYYPVEMSGVISEILRHSGRYVVVGIPCFIKALRLACRQSPVLHERVVFTVAIVCGHLKSSAFAELCGWQCGFMPGSMQAIDFRAKLPDRPASHYGVTVTGVKAGEAVSVTRPATDFYGSNWGYGFFKYKACDFCDDVVGETADVSVGDAWLPEFESDSAGTNIVTVRSRAIDTLLQEGLAQGRLHLEGLQPERVAESQAGGFRHRRDGLAYRLWLEDLAGRWRPAKRVEASADHLSRRQRTLFELRTKLAEESHPAFLAAKRAGELGVFLQRMRPLTSAYDELYRPVLWLRVVRKMKRVLSRLLGASR